VLCNEPRVFNAEIAADSRQFRCFEKLCRRSLAARSQLVSYLSCATFFLENSFRVSRARLSASPLHTGLLRIASMISGERTSRC
jgi:hypothetical protein